MGLRPFLKSNLVQKYVPSARAVNDPIRTNVALDPRAQLAQQLRGGIDLQLRYVLISIWPFTQQRDWQAAFLAPNDPSPCTTAPEHGILFMI